MKNIYKINVENFKLTVNEALAQIESEIDALKITNTKCVLKVIHGYGSSGCGGEIKKQIPAFLNSLKARSKIEDFVENSKFGVLSTKYKKYTNIFPELILDNDLKNLNPGITIIFL